MKQQGMLYEFWSEFLVLFKTICDEAGKFSALIPCR